MRILFLTQIVPYPPDAGPKVKTWNSLRYLASQGHDVVLATFVRPEERDHLAEVRNVCSQVHPVPLKRSRIGDLGYWIRSLASGKPFLVERDASPAMRRLVERLVKEQPFDVVHADQITMSQFALPLAEEVPDGPTGSRPKLVLDAHNAVWTILDRMSQNAALPLRPILALEAKRLLRYEGKIVSLFDRTLAVSEVDRRALYEAVGTVENGRGPRNRDRIEVVPIAVDTERLKPSPAEPDADALVTMGTLHYPPNADGIRWFVHDVLPLIQEQAPSVTLTIIGKNPPTDLIRAAQSSGGRVSITGYVPDLDPYMEKAAVFVVPVRSGGGMRVRILEGLARGLPMVTTTVGLEGIQARAGKEVLVADSAKEFAQAVVNLIHDRKLRRRLSKASRALAVAHYDWQVVLRGLDRTYAPEIS